MKKLTTSFAFNGSMPRRIHSTEAKNDFKSMAA